MQVNNNIITIILTIILLYCIYDLFKEKFQNVVCEPGKVEGGDGKCVCPLVGQIYDNENKKCICGLNKKEITINNKLVCM